MRSAIVEGEVVINVIVGELPGSIPCPDNIGPGWGYVDGEFVAPVEPDEDGPVPVPGA